MIIEFQNTIAPKNHSTMAMAIVITASAFFFIPTTLIILGYYSSQPTGNLISPLPQGTLSNRTTPAPQQAEAIPEVTPEIVPDNQPIIASDNSASDSANQVVDSSPGSNILDKEATMEAGVLETVIHDPEVNEDSQIYLTPREGDKAIYSVKSKTVGRFTISTNTASDVVRHIDYAIVKP